MFLNSHDGKGLEAGGQLTNVSRIREGLENIILEKCLKHWIFFSFLMGMAHLSLNQGQVKVLKLKSHWIIHPATFQEPISYRIQFATFYILSA